LLKDNEYLKIAVTDTPIVTVDLLIECIQSLKLRKAAGHDNISNEHLVFSNNDFVVHTCLLFTAMLKHSWVPTNLAARNGS